MIRQSTIDKLHEMRLSAMADAFENQCADAATYQNLSFEDRFGMLVDREWEKRKNSKLQKLIRNAGFRSNIIQTGTWIKDRCLNFQPAVI